MLPNFPPAGPGYLSSLVVALKKAFLPVVSCEEAAPRIILQSPNGTNYNVTVSNAGALVVALNDGKTRP